MNKKKNNVSSARQYLWICVLLLLYLLCHVKAKAEDETSKYFPTSMSAYGYEHDDHSGSGSANARESIYGEWWLVGWNDGGNWLEVDTNYISHRHLSIEIPEEGCVMAYSMVNEICVGLLTLNGNEMTFGGEMQGVMTMVYCDIMENLFFEEHICDIKSYQLEGNLLKLYYTDDYYFVFTSDFDDSEERFYEWKDGPSDPYIGEVTAMNDGEAEAKIVYCPPYVTSYSRNRPPTGNREICHFAVSDLSDLSFEVGDKIPFRIIQFKRLRTDNGKEYQLKVEPCEGSEYVTDRAGTMHNDRRMGWIIIDDEMNERQGGIYYYPLKTLPDVFQQEGKLVVFSGELYPTWLMPWDNQGDSDNYYLSVDDISSDVSDLTTVHKIATAKTAMSSDSFDLQGRRVTGQPRRGVYIQDGRKRVR